MRVFANMAVTPSDSEYPAADLQTEARACDDSNRLQYGTQPLFCVAYLSIDSSDIGDSVI